MKTGTKASIGPGLEAEQVGAVTVLEDEHEQPERRARRQQVEQDRLDRDDDRAEGDEQQHERQGQDEADDLGHAVAVEVDDVGRERGPPGDERLDAVHAAEHVGHDRLAHLAHDVAVAQVVLAAGHDHRQQRHRPVRGGLGLGRAAQAVDLQQPLLQRLDGGLGRRLVRSGDHDLEGERGALRPLLVEQVHALDGVDGVRERGEVALAQVQPERGDGHRQQQLSGRHEGDRPAGA